MTGERIDDAAVPSASAIVPLRRNGDFMLLMSGQQVSALGSSISRLAFLLLALDVTHSPAQAGFITGLGAVPFLLLALPAGAWADRWDRRRVLLMLCDTGRALVLASIPVALWLGHLTVAQLYIAALLEGALATIYNITGLANLPRIVETRQLTQATSVDYTLRSVVRLVGPALGGILYGARQALPFVADAVSYVGSVLSLRWMTARFQEDRQRASRHLGREIVAGVIWMWRQPVLRFQAIAGCILSFALFPNTLLVTVLAQRQHASDAVIGLIFALAAVGTLVGSLLAPRVQRWLGFGQVIAGMFCGMALLWPLYALASSGVLLGLITAAIYLVESIGSIVNLGYRLALTSDQYQGRVNSLHRLIGFGVGQPLGAFVAGLLLDRFDPRVAIFSYAMVLALMALATSLYCPVWLAKRLT